MIEIKSSNISRLDFFFDNFRILWKPNCLNRDQCETLSINVHSSEPGEVTDRWLLRRRNSEFSRDSELRVLILPVTTKLLVLPNCPAQCRQFVILRSSFIVQSDA